MRFPKLIKAEYYSSPPKGGEIWIRRLSFLVNRRLRDEFISKHSIRKALKTYKTYLKRQNKIRVLYMLMVNSKKSPEERKSWAKVKKEFEEMGTFFTEYLYSANKAVYLLDLPKGIKNIKKRVKNKKYKLLFLFGKLPLEICIRIFEYTFTY